MDANKLANIFGNLMGYEVRSYIGRGMRGRECIGVVVPNNINIFSLGAQAAYHAENSDDVYEMSKLNPRTDDLGRNDTIVYFPDIEWPWLCLKFPAKL